MLKSYEGIYRDGRIELTESPPSHLHGKVIVTFVDAESVDLADRGIDKRQAADLRHRLSTFAEDWNLPEMDAYDAV